MRRSPPPPSPSPSSLHSNFFSSLKQVEKRLKLETLDTNSTPTESLSTPIYLATHNNFSPTNPQENSEPPLEFLSSCPSSQQQPTTITDQSPQTDSVDDIQRLMQLLGLSQIEQTDEEDKETGCECDCEGGFYEKIVGVKGPKCKKEVERLQGWISYFVKNKIEPFRLAFLLVGQAAFQSDGGLEFPSTVEDFLKYDPPRD